MGSSSTHHITSNRVNRGLQRKNRNRYLRRRDALVFNSSKKETKTSSPNTRKKPSLIVKEKGLFSSQEKAWFTELAILLAIVVPVVVWLLVTYIA